MNKIFLMIILCSFTLSLSACITTVDDVSVKTDEYSVRVQSNNNPDGYNFCPPGHAKKGWC